jgi:cholesterol transport system auxiliary component
MRRIVVIAIAAWLAGCAVMGERQANRYYLLEPRSAAVAPRSGAITPAPTTAASFYDTQDIVFSRSPGTRGYYQFSHWTERPQRVIQDELAARYVPDRDGYVLATHLVEIYHDAASAPGTSRVTVAAELVERTHRTLVARRTFTRDAPAASHDAGGAVAGFNAAAGAVLDDIVGWADSEAAARSARNADGIVTLP